MPDTLFYILTNCILEKRAGNSQILIHQIVKCIKFDDKLIEYRARDLNQMKFDTSNLRYI